MANTAVQPKLSKGDIRRRLADIDAKINEHRDTLARTDEEWTNDAADIVKRMWKSWPVARAWLEEVYGVVEREGRVEGPTGRIRNLPAAFHSSEAVAAAMKRRGPNSVIQGLASDIGIMSGYCIAREVWRTFVSKGLPMVMVQLNAVHDSMTYESPIEFTAVGAYLIEHGMTSLVMDEYARIYKFDISIPLSFDLEIGLNEGEMEGWKDLRFDTLARLIETTAKKTNASKREIRNALHNAEKIAGVRLKELRSNPYRCTLEGKTNWYKENLKWSIAA